jgi:hypothetical protein
VDGGTWDVDPSNVEPSKVDPKIVALTGVCDDGVDELEKLGTPPKIGGRLRKSLEQREFYGSPMVSN